MYYKLNDDLSVSKTTVGGLDFSIENRQVGRYELGPILLSTVFLCIDHAHFGGEPVLFETMLFIGSSNDTYMRRYSEYKKAKMGHDSMLATNIKGFLLPLMRKKRSWRRIKKALEKSDLRLENSMRAAITSLSHQLTHERHF